MIINVNEQFDVSPEWFDKESNRNGAEAWQKRLCELLSIYRLHDEDGAKKAGEIMKRNGIDEMLVDGALE